MRRWSQEWWDQVVAGYTEEEFVQNFRMSRNAFHHICQRLSPRHSRGHTSFRRSIYLRKQVGVGLYWVAMGADYRTLANLFGIAKSSVCAIVHDFCKAVHQILIPDYIKIPQGDYLQEVLGFRQRFPPVCWGDRREQCSVGQNDVKVTLNVTWLFRLRSHSKKSDTYPIQYHI